MNFKARTATLAELIQLHEKGELVGVFDIPAEVYHAAPGISKSALDDVEESPATFFYKRAHPDEPTDEMEFGNALHTAILEPEHFKARYAVAGPELNRRGTKAWDAFEADNPGKIILKYEAGQKLDAMVAAAHGHSRAGLLTGLKELSFFWKDPETGLLCKCRPDNITDKAAVVDYKSAMAVYPARAWAAAVFRQRYHVQSAFYLDGVANAVAQSGVTLPVPLPDAFVFFAQQKHEPFLVKPWKLGQGSQLLGQRECRKNLATILECEKTQRWPGYPEHIEDVECPEYAWAEELGTDDGGEFQ